MTTHSASKTAITGSSGLIGSALCGELERRGSSVVRLRRDTSNRGDWNPKTGELSAAALNECSAFVHLAGVSLGGRWTESKKRAIRESRVEATAKLVTALAQLPAPPSTLICASAVGYYGDRGEEVLNENSSNGAGFLAEVCRDWEVASRRAEAAGMRVVQLRLAMVLSSEGGALSPMLPLFRMGLGGRLGSGCQWWSWIERSDAVRAICCLIDSPDSIGAFNLASPSPARNSEFTRALGAVLRRPAVLPAPAWALRLALGEPADALLLASSRVMPDRLLAQGFEFTHPDLAGALQALLK